ncbi:outer membrane lipoprotein carrier protein LolA [Deinococcus yavapaiensis]|uniref:Outer membrane lipoprotein-sorting protein n=1 Tax=Deinococcus yavapaiensis KR-236 TaxID=694435 RepID=A0A318SBY7_9DEIO|nr:outer membrane lipoprotein carrier protein LolA [Deinococcus yavapaiensis]PYE54388.1 outer membrane lipoprotein-sorting protein [Deinococcus yavapaiensis KR-236]
MKKISLLFLALLGSAFAQSANEIVSKVEAAQKNVKDYSFKISGTANFEGGSQKLDLDVKAIPSASVARVQFNAPDALADNIIVVDKNTVSTYLYLTNQITVQTVKSSSAGGFNFDFSQLTNASQFLSDNYNVKLVDTDGASGNRTFVLEATSKNGGTDRNRVWIAEQGWRPTRVQVFNGSGKVTTDLTISNYKTNTGLTSAKLRALPKDAEVVKR